MDNNLLYKLLTWLSPSYPIGSYAYSHGLEYAVEVNLITNEKTLYEWINFILRFGSACMDSWLIKEAYEALHSSSVCDSVQELIIFGNTLKPTPELWQESYSQGSAFLKILLETDKTKKLVEVQQILKDQKLQAPFPIIYGIVCAEYEIPFDNALTSYLHAFVSNLVSAGVRIIPLGQTAGQRIIKDLGDDIQIAVKRFETIQLDTLGTASPMVDWTSSKHETQYTRIFQS